MVRRLSLLVVALAACQSPAGLLIPDASFDTRGIFFIDRPATGDIVAPSDVLVAIAPDGAVIGTVAPDGAVIAPDGAIVGGALPDGAVVASDGAVIGSVRDAGSADAPPLDGTTTDGSIGPDGATADTPATPDATAMDGGRTDATSPPGDAQWPISNDGAVRPDAFLPDGAPVCPTSWRACGSLCIAPGTCCDTTECLGGRACSFPGGQCSCRENTRMCGSQCIPESACCADSDCPSGFRCPSVGGLCADSNGCIVGLRTCMGRCIAAGACCTTADCVDGTCAGPGAFCSGTSRCARGSRDCSGQCIPSSTCCSNTDCPMGFVCPMAGAQCGCPRGQRLCNGNRCIAAEACCTDDDCPATSCPTPGMPCAPVPPRIGVKRWGIDPVDGGAGEGGSGGYAHYELTTTADEERAMMTALGASASGEGPRYTLLTDRYFTIYGTGVCPRNTAALWSLEQPPTAWPRVDRVLTVSTPERDFMVRDGWRATQIGCAVSTTSTCPSGTITVTRYQLPRAPAERHRFVLSADSMEASRAGFLYEGVAFCVW
ncbi:MAG: hypothetical protein U0326_31920 [Polyangiales bacterium]